MDNINTDAKSGYRRIEVLTGPGRRRRWLPAEKARVVAETLLPGATVSEVARRWQLSSQQLFTWRREARSGQLALPAEAARREKPNFVPIVAEAAPGISIGGGVEPSPASDRGSKAGSHHPIEIRLAGALIRVAPGADYTLLTEVLRALRASAT